jgi:hypothetical protein
MEVDEHAMTMMSHQVSQGIHHHAAGGESCFLHGQCPEGGGSFADHRRLPEPGLPIDDVAAI